MSTRHCLNQSPQACYSVLRVIDGIDYRLSSLQNLLASIPPNEPICIVVHGSFIIWESFLVQSDATDLWLKQAAPGRPLHTIYFTWPSEAPTEVFPVYNINILGKRSALHGYYLAQLLQSLPASNPVSLVGHSHGARLISSALNQLSLMRRPYDWRVHNQFGNTNDHRPYRRIRAIFAAAAIDHHWLNAGQRYQFALHSVEALVNLRNIYDLPLNYYQFRKPFGERALAESGFTRLDYYRLGQNAQKIIEYDVSRLVGNNHWWPYYYKQRQIADLIAPYVFFTDLPAR